MKCVCSAENFRQFEPGDVYKYFKEDILDGDDDPDNVDLSTFDKLELRMVAVTTDGGVKKEVLRPGSGDIVYPGACVTGQSSLSAVTSLYNL